MGSSECGIEFDRKHIKSSFKLILQSDALPKRWRKFKLSHLAQLIVVNSLMNLRDPNLVLARLGWIVHGNTRGISLLVPSHHAVFLDVETLIEKNVAVYLLNDVILYQDQAIYLDVDGEPICVEARRYFLVDLDKDVVCRLLD